MAFSLRLLPAYGYAKEGIQGNKYPELILLPYFLNLMGSQRAGHDFFFFFLDMT